jgi:hypothetical protein
MHILPLFEAKKSEKADGKGKAPAAKPSFLNKKGKGKPGAPPAKDGKGKAEPKAAAPKKGKIPPQFLKHVKKKKAVKESKFANSLATGVEMPGVAPLVDKLSKKMSKAKPKLKAKWDAFVKAMGVANTATANEGVVDDNIGFSEIAVKHLLRKLAPKLSNEAKIALTGIYKSINEDDNGEVEIEDNEGEDNEGGEGTNDGDDDTKYDIAATLPDWGNDEGSEAEYLDFIGSELDKVVDDPKGECSTQVTDKVNQIQGLILELRKKLAGDDEVDVDGDANANVDDNTDDL